MDNMPESGMTLRQALAGKWQIPLFLVALVLFVGLLFQLRPSKQDQNFDEKYLDLVKLSQQSRFSDFYSTAELLRLEAETQQELGRVHGVVAQTRSRQLRSKGELAVDASQSRSSEANYRTILLDYDEAIKREWVTNTSEEIISVYHDMGLAHWCLNDAEQAIEYLEKAVTARKEMATEINRDLVKVYLVSQPEAYLEKAAPLLEEILEDGRSSLDDKGWAFVRKAEVMLAQGQEEAALDLLNSESNRYKDSSYSHEMEFMRGRALRHGGEVDLADLILRDLLKRIGDRGDIYAQVCLELGEINFSQFRDHEAKQFFQNVSATQLGKDWYLGGLFGLAQCAAMQKRYEDSIDHYHELVQLLKSKPYNRVVDNQEIQESLEILSRQLSMQKDYDLALRFMEIENQVAQGNDVRVVERYARMNEWRAEQLLEEYDASHQAGTDQVVTQADELWSRQQKRMILYHFEKSAEGYLKVAKLAVDQDAVYDESLWKAATNYDRAGNAGQSINTWQRIVTESSGKPQWPLALYRLAQSYQAIGDYDSAIEYYVLLQQRHPKSPDVFKSMVALAKCHLSKEQVDRDKAEGLLRAVLTNRAVTPKAAIYRDALYELGKLYYDHQDFEQAIAAFNEVIDRYPDESFMGKAFYMAGDAYRQSGLALDGTLEQLAQDPTAAVNQEKTMRLRQQYLEQARASFNRAISFYDGKGQERLSEVDETYLRYCWLYRAACLFDLEMYRQAAEAYEEAALRYQLTPMALGAFVQVMNCQLMLGDAIAAKSTQKRAIWQLRKMPDASFGGGDMDYTRDQWNDWFAWMDRARLW